MTTASGSIGANAKAAFSAKTLKTGQVAVCFFDEGALGTARNSWMIW
jgi:hypothetical protein